LLLRDGVTGVPNAPPAVLPPNAQTSPSDFPHRCPAPSSHGIGAIVAYDIGFAIEGPSNGGQQGNSRSQIMALRGGDVRCVMTATGGGRPPRSPSEAAARSRRRGGRPFNIRRATGA